MSHSCTPQDRACHKDGEPLRVYMLCGTTSGRIPVRSQQVRLLLCHSLWHRMSSRSARMWPQRYRPIFYIAENVTL